jgi:predicted dehydrogenase
MGQNHKRVLESLGHDVLTVDPAGHADYLRIEDAPKVDVACIATPADSLAKSALEMIQRYTPTLVEKPFAPSYEAAEWVVDVAETMHVQIAAGFVERANPALGGLKQNLPLIGPVRHYSAERLSPTTYGDVAFDLASHELDAANYIFGRVRPVKRTGDSTTSVFTGDSAGVTYCIQASGRSPVRVRKLRVTGDHGSLDLDYRAQTLSFTENDATRPIHVQPAEPLAVQWQAFLSGRPLATGVDAISVLNQIESA